MTAKTFKFSFKRKLLLSFLTLAMLGYISTCFYLYTHQRQLILRPSPILSTFPDDSRFNDNSLESVLLYLRTIEKIITTLIIV
jgi:hypothetical protein